MPAVAQFTAKGCKDCGCAIPSESKSRDFCTSSCRSNYHNRRKQRGADLYDLFMALRFDRAAAQEQGAWSLMCRMAAQFRMEDQRDRGGLPSWDSVKDVRERSPQMNVMVVATNAAGSTRR